MVRDQEVSHFVLLLPGDPQKLGAHCYGAHFSTAFSFSSGHPHGFRSNFQFSRSGGLVGRFKVENKSRTTPPEYRCIIVMQDAAKRLTNQYAVVSGEINGLEVRVLPGSPSVFGPARRHRCKVKHRPCDGASRSLKREFEQVIMVEVRIEEMFGSD